MRIGLNLLHARPAIGGAWNYIAGVLDVLKRLDTQNRYIAYCNPASQALVAGAAHIESRLVNSVGVNQFARIVCENSWLQYRSRRDRLDLMHWFANVQSLVTTVPAAITVYDLRWIENLKEYDPLRMIYARIMIPRSVRRARAIFPISATTGAGLEQRLGVQPEKIFVINYPLGPEWTRATGPQIAELRRKYALPQKFWLYVAHAYPHKNHRTLFEAYARLKSEDANAWTLVLRGEDKGESKLDNLAREIGIADSVLRLPTLEKEEMPVLYSAATALVFPSKYEGLGIPLLEALACGCPAIASSIPTTLEFGGDNVVMCDPADAGAFTHAMAKFQRDPALLADYSNRGVLCAANFSPARVFESLMAGYEFAARPRL